MSDQIQIVIASSSDQELVDVTVNSGDGTGTSYSVTSRLARDIVATAAATLMSAVGQAVPVPTEIPPYVDPNPPTPAAE